MAKKTIIRLTEGDLHNIIIETTKKVLNPNRKLRSDERKTVMPGLFADDPEFDTTEVKIERPKKVSKQEKERRKQAKKEERQDNKQKEKNQKDKEFYNAWAKKGVVEKSMFESIDESIDKILYHKLHEARNLQSQKLYNFLQQHGGFSKYHQGNFSNLTDQDIIGVYTRQQVQQMFNQGRVMDHGKWAENDGLDAYAKSQGIQLGKTDEVSKQELADGTILLYIDRNARFDRQPQNDTDTGWKQYWNKKQNRESNRWGDGAKQYQPMTPKSQGAQWLRKNPYYWDAKRPDNYDRDNGWRDPKERQRVMNNIRTGNVKNGIPT